MRCAMFTHCAVVASLTICISGTVMLSAENTVLGGT